MEFFIYLFFLSLNYLFTRDCWLTICLSLSNASIFAESPEGQEAALKAFQSLEPGDFPGFLKLLRKPSSQRLQSRCTAFLNTIDAYHVNLSPSLPFPVSISARDLPENMFLLIRGSYLFYFRTCLYRSSQTWCRISIRILLFTSVVSPAGCLWEIS